jgi:pimeloyl-ACP methyl ester carboxylesterase
VEGFTRNLITYDSTTRLRPDPGLTEELRVAVESLDLIPVYRDVRCPLLLVLATEDMPEQQPFHELYAAYRRGITERISTVHGNGRLRVVHLDGASHAMVAERPQHIADLVTDFLTAAATRGTSVR